MEKIEYPKWVYSEKEEPKIVKDKPEHDALKKGWEESPVVFADKKEAPKEKKAPKGKK